jgi:hypothetical protein
MDDTTIMTPHVTKPGVSLSSSSSLSSSLDSKNQTRRIGDVTPRNQNTFDPWNSASTGHQRAENPYSQSTQWRRTRTEKLSRQFQGLPSDSAGNNSRGKKKTGGEWRWLSAEEAKRNELGCQDIRNYLGRLKKGQTDHGAIAISSKKSKSLPSIGSPSSQQPAAYTPIHYPPPPPPPPTREELLFCENNGEIKIDHDHATSNSASDDHIPSSTAEKDGQKKEKKKNSISPKRPPEQQQQNQERGRGIFTGLTFYINGSTAPLVSDHKLKQLLVENGGNISIALGRRTVTHVILGKPNCSRNTGAGGGLAAGKLQKEILRVGGKGVKFVGVEWYVWSFIIIIIFSFPSPSNLLFFFDKKKDILVCICMFVFMSAD